MVNPALHLFQLDMELKLNVLVKELTLFLIQDILWILHQKQIRSKRLDLVYP